MTPEQSLDIIEFRRIDFDPMVDKDVAEMFDSSSHFHGDKLLVQILREVRALREEVKRLSGKPEVHP